MVRGLRRYILLVCVLVDVMSAGAQERDWFEAGPFAAEFPTVWESGWRSEAMGTLAWWEESGDGHGWGWSPLLSYEATPVLDREQLDMLYPVLTWRRSGAEHRWQIGQLINIAGGNRQLNDEQTIRRTIFPFFFQQKSASGTNDYFALFPFYGHLYNRVLRDEIDFVMAPLYVKTRKGTTITRNYVFPLFHLREGPGLKGWQLWPLYGEEHKEVNWRTNTLGDRVLSPGRDRWFALWPLILSERGGLGTTNESRTSAVLPFYSLERSPARDQTRILWPFFGRTEDRANDFVEWGAPWPFIGWANGSGKTARRFWPFFGRVQTAPEPAAGRGNAPRSQLRFGSVQAGGSRREFLLWPLYTHRTAENETLKINHWQSVFFLYDDYLLQGKETGTYRRTRGVWPFFSWHRALDGRERLQVLAPLETIFRNRDAVERNYAPLWSLYRSQSNPKTGAAFQSVLWNFFRRDVTTNTVRTACLFGLVQTRRDDDGDRHWRLFWLPNRNFAPTPSPAPPATNSPAAPPKPAAFPSHADRLAEPRRGDALVRSPRPVTYPPAMAKN